MPLVSCLRCAWVSLCHPCVAIVLDSNSKADSSSSTVDSAACNDDDNEAFPLKAADANSPARLLSLLSPCAPVYSSSCLSDGEQEGTKAHVWAYRHDMELESTSIPQKSPEDSLKQVSFNESPRKAALASLFASMTAFVSQNNDNKRDAAITKQHNNKSVNVHSRSVLH